ncbi:MAG: hypothetical protein HY689_07165 [Chloroflexi bacterium]|nr:hypothetical protein [Chloroflexota bacterium]
MLALGAVPVLVQAAGERTITAEDPSPHFAGPPPFALLTDVRVAQHEGFDRIVFEFRGTLPEHQVRFIQPPATGCASGLPIEVSGAVLLELRFQPAAGFDTEQGVPSYTGPTEIVANLPTLVEAQRTCDFEAVLTWVLGLDQVVTPRVFELTDPFRVVVDLPHQPGALPRTGDIGFPREAALLVGAIIGLSGLFIHRRYAYR